MSPPLDGSVPPIHPVERCELKVRAAARHRQRRAAELLLRGLDTADLRWLARQTARRLGAP